MRRQTLVTPSPGSSAAYVIWTADDYRYMARAIRLAKRGMYATDPNPRVGCVLVKRGVIIGEGWHRRAGGPHAEINALAEAGDQARGATCYVSLEPCCHYGRTLPCTDALITAGVDRVVAVMTDPNPRVSGKGLLALKEAGVFVESGLLEAEARELNPGFIKRMRDGLPYVRCKLAMSLDGHTAMASGESKWITSPESRGDVQRLRARSSAVMTGIGTVLADDPSLAVRDPSFDTGGCQPLRVVVDSRLRMPAQARMLVQPGQTLILTVLRGKGGRRALSGAEIVELGEANGRVDLRAALQYLASKEINEVLLEAGPVLTGAMLSAGLVDELVIYIAPKFLGSEALAVAELPGIKHLADCLRLTITDIRLIGSDLRITTLVKHEP